jgi:hypothetical protein
VEGGRRVVAGYVAGRGGRGGGRRKEGWVEEVRFEGGVRERTAGPGRGGFLYRRDSPFMSRDLPTKEEDGRRMYLRESDLEWHDIFRLAFVPPLDHIAEQDHCQCDHHREEHVVLDDSKHRSRADGRLGGDSLSGVADFSCGDGSERT